MRRYPGEMIPTSATFEINAVVPRPPPVQEIKSLLMKPEDRNKPWTHWLEVACNMLLDCYVAHRKRELIEANADDGGYGWP